MSDFKSAMADLHAMMDLVGEVAQSADPDEVNAALAGIRARFVFLEATMTGRAAQAKPKAPVRPAGYRAPSNDELARAARKAGMGPAEVLLRFGVATDAKGAPKAKPTPLPVGRPLTLKDLGF